MEWIVNLQSQRDTERHTQGEKEEPHLIEFDAEVVVHVEDHVEAGHNDVQRGVALAQHFHRLPNLVLWPGITWCGPEQAFEMQRTGRDGTPSVNRVHETEC